MTLFKYGDRVANLEDRKGTVEEVVREGTQVIYVVQHLWDQGVVKAYYLEDELRPANQ